MNWQESICDLNEEVRRVHPLIHHITNLVVTNVTANITLAAGAAPVMLGAVEDAADMTTRRYKVPLIINDRVDVALAVDAEGVHLGQEDIPCALARKLVGPDKILGISASSVEEALQAEKDGADYLGVGAVFPTGTKADAGDAIGLEKLRVIRQSVNIPIVAIGGINAGNAAAVAATGVAGLSVVSAIVSAPDPKKAACILRQAFVQGQSHVNSLEVKS